MEQSTHLSWHTTNTTQSHKKTALAPDKQSVPALRAARTDQPAVAEMPTHSFVQPATRLKP